MTDNRERLGIYLPLKLKEKLRDIHDETGYSMNQLSLMALCHLVASYEDDGLSIFEEMQKTKSEVVRQLK
ncbi:hypothetical protein M3181_22045 [Mesobacillus maritimus]|uniref:hypothetical protein n=1 Tax=Mesobacillus maritimus TaxID=1643336 RepID=UPI00203FF626|nr:hypothetical protein [Mesobacillus maritimus]MCM3671642.1 hypothetical protein [Mesobacillus maritimus]